MFTCRGEMGKELREGIVSVVQFSCSLTFHRRERPESNITRLCLIINVSATPLRSMVLWECIKGIGIRGWRQMHSRRWKKIIVYEGHRDVRWRPERPAGARSCVREFDVYSKIRKNQLKDFNSGREGKRPSDLHFESVILKWGERISGSRVHGEANEETTEEV